MRYRVAAVSYLNTRPFLDGFAQSGLDRDIDLFLLPPSQCAEFLKNQKVDIALFPVGALPGLNNYSILGSYCIGCQGAVRTVALYSDVPLERMEAVYLDAHSRTSNLLVQILLQKHWKRDIPVLPPPANGKQVRTGLLSIGDRCFALDKLFKYKYDLGQVWFDYTGLPFVFACWVSREPVSPEFVAKLELACETGVKNIANLQIDHGFLSQDDLKEYLSNAIDFNLDAGKQQALKVFLKEIRELPTRPKEYVT